ncbi:hypothetical protein OIU85_024092 [Salix viminalis]|uniref:Uncharacterized protein n=1 Tax=Salix viminalis TaxID=40686 RepID=A0A9Q0U023_SALVM|nr:hypothetical protein OIU85_024092 [Salix viminalis]
MRTEVHRAGGMNPFISHPEFHDPTTPIPSPSLPRHSILTVKRKQVRERDPASSDYSDAWIQKNTQALQAKRDSESLKWQKCSDQSIETVLCNHKTNYAVKSNGHGDALKSFVW